MVKKSRNLIIVLAAAASIAAALTLLPTKEYFLVLLDRTRTLGPIGPILLAAIYIPSCVLLLPGSALTLGAGYLFGVATGTIAVSVGSALGAAAAFLVGRKLARNWVLRRISGNARFKAIDHAVGRHGFKIVFLSRLSPLIPFTLLNYAYGVTRVSFRDYFFASWSGMLPGSILYVYLGSAARSLTDLAAGRIEGGWPQKVAFAAGLVATAGVVWFVSRVARRAIETEAPSGEPSMPREEASDG